MKVPKIKYLYKEKYAHLARIRYHYILKNYAINSYNRLLHIFTQKLFQRTNLHASLQIILFQEKSKSCNSSCIHLQYFRVSIVPRSNATEMRGTQNITIILKLNDLFFVKSCFPMDLFNYWNFTDLGQSYHLTLDKLNGNHYIWKRHNHATCVNIIFL